MRITSSTVDAHEFTLVRKKGYDPAEVDAVMHRLVETLREYEDSVGRLERELREAEQSEEAIKRTFVAAQRTKDEMLEEARREAHAIKAKAKQEADATSSAVKAEVEIMLAKARDEAQAVFDDATATLARANADADQTRAEANEVLEAAKSKADSIRSQADEVLTSSMSEAEAIREEAERYLRSHQEQAEATLARANEEAEKTTSTARAVAERVVSDAKSEAAEKLATSRREAEALIGSAVAEAKSQRARVKTELEELRSSRSAEAEELLTAARNEAEELRTKSAAEAEVVTSQARAEAEELVHRAKTDAADRISSSQAQAEKILDHARGRADEIVRDARTDKTNLERRVAQLRTAVSDIERELHKLAEAALERVAFVSGVIDLTQQDAAAAVDVTSAAALPTVEARRGAAVANRPTTPHPIPAPPQTEPGESRSFGTGGATSAGPENRAVAVATIETTSAPMPPSGPGGPPAEQPAAGDEARSRDEHRAEDSEPEATVAAAETADEAPTPDVRAAAVVDERTEAVATTDTVANDPDQAGTEASPATAPTADSAELRQVQQTVEPPPRAPEEADEAQGPIAASRPLGESEGEPKAAQREAAGDVQKPRFATPEEATRIMVERRRHSFSAPDGSGRPPAERDLVEPSSGLSRSQATDPDEEERPATIYQRRGGGIRRRLQGRSIFDEKSGSGDSDADAGTE